MHTLLKEALAGPNNMKTMISPTFHQLLEFSKFACEAPPYGNIDSKSVSQVRGCYFDWVAVNYVPFGEKALTMVVNLYQRTACDISPLVEQFPEEVQADEIVDCQVIELLRDEILPYCHTIPKEFILKVVVLLNKGSIHSASGLTSLVLFPYFIFNMSDSDHIESDCSSIRLFSCGSSDLYEPYGSGQSSDESGFAVGGPSTKSKHIKKKPNP
uniref:Mon2 C-terminal domain-containing protein n=1 Tax=Timema bartmani TaxID=61472 RepID=A0A7R9F422_9NEOP|nr:unnamed protein product [Timema bartmani]